MLANNLKVIINFTRSMSLPLVSIIMPVKNAMPFLNECLLSIINQTYINWELIAVNDNSTDTSFELLNFFAQKDKRIKPLNNKKEGIIEALKTGYAISKGDFITRMDADDIMTPDKIEVLANKLLQNGKGHIAVGAVKYFSETTLGNGYKKYEQWLNYLTSNGNNFSELYKEFVIPSPSWMVYRTDFEKCGAFNSDFYPEDYDLCYRFYQNNLKCIPCKKQIHLWRDYGNRTSRTHKNYADNKFSAIKVHYFKLLSLNLNRKLILWGAGRRGKEIAKLLLELKVEFEWACNNKNKIGHTIYGKTLLSTKNIWINENPQIIITVANQTEQQNIKATLKLKKLKTMEDYFFFC